MSVINDAVFQRATITSQLWDGRLLSKWEEYIFLFCQSGTTAAAYSSFRKAGSTSDYSVPTGKKLRVLALLLSHTHGSTFSAGEMTQFGYADNGVGLVTGTNPTNQTHIEVAADPGSSNVNSSVFLAQSTELYMPASKYPYVYNPVSSGNGYGLLVGIEEDL